MALSSAAAITTAPGSISTEGSTVKQEKRDDDEEINALAARMVEQHKAKMATAARAPVTGGPAGPTQMVNSTQPAISNFLSRSGQAPAVKGQTNPQAPATTPSSQNSSEKPPCDADSQKMRFGWVTLGKNHIPYILRYGTEKYCAVRMVEVKLLSKYLTYLHPDIYSCTCIRSYYITDPEARLLNDINGKHCDFQFGREPFTTKDLVVRLQDADEFYTFLDVCYNKLLPQNNSHSNKCGFIRIDGESVVPYILRNGTKYVPVFYFEGEISSLFQKSETLEGWDLAYLKFCCKVQGIRAELFEKDNCSVISLEDIKGYFPSNTDFEDYWPSKVVDRQLLVSSNKNDSSASWTISPTVSASAGSVSTSTTTTSNKVTTGTSAVSRQSAHNAAYLSNGWNGLVGGQPTYHSSQAQANHMQAMMQGATPRYQTTQAQARSGLPSGLTSAAVSAAPGSSHQYYQQGSIHSMVSQGSAVQPPPPLVRVTGSQPTMGRSSSMYTNASALSHMMNMQGSQHSSQMLPPPQPHSHYSAASSNNKYPPPPLVSVNGTTSSSRYPYMSTNGADVIDLSSPPQSPQLNQRQQQHHVSNGKTTAADGRSKLIALPDYGTSGTHIPYKVQKVLVEGRMVPCINAKPYINTELLMTLPDLAAHFFPSLSLTSCRQGLQEVLRLELYRGNRQQMVTLKEAGKCASVSDNLPLVQVGDVIKYMPQMKYMFAPRRSSEEPPAKIKRTS